MVGAFFLLAGFIGVLALGYNASQKKPAKIGMPLPELAFTTFDNQMITSPDLKGKVVLINFWASWCEPCEAEAPLLEKTWQYFKSRGNVLFLGVDYVDTEQQACQFLQTYRVTYPNGPDLRSEISRTFRVSGVPETFLFGTDGTLARVIIGPISSEEELIQLIETLIKQAG